MYTYKPAARRRIDELVDQQKHVGRYMDRSAVTGFDLINARRLWHNLDKQIDDLCRRSGLRRVP